MSMPPPPGQWGPSGPPPPPGPPQQGPPAGYYPPPGPSGGPPQPPPKQNNTIKWLLAGVGVLLIIAITVGVTVLVTRDSSGGDGPTTTPTGEPIASADDDGPIEIITLEPTCQAWMPVSNAMSTVQGNGWADRDTSIPASKWTVAQRAEYDAVGDSLRESANQAVELAGRTPHRVVRHLYEQFVAYSRAYADSIPSYMEPDNFLARASVASSWALDAVCDSITYGSAGAVSSAVPAIGPPSVPMPNSDPANPSRFITSSDEQCMRVLSDRDDFLSATGASPRPDPNIPAAQWNSEQRLSAESIVPAMTDYAAAMEEVGEATSNPVLQDIAYFVAVYLRAYVVALPSYEPADNYLVVVGTRAANLLTSACESVTQ